MIYKPVASLHGFRSLHSTLNALLETSNNWCVNVDKGVIFIDFRKGFDTIDHEIILQKLLNMGWIKMHWNGLNLTYQIVYNDAT